MQVVVVLISFVAGFSLVVVTPSVIPLMDGAAIGQSVKDYPIVGSLVEPVDF